jgi:hypothetical protein
VTVDPSTTGGTDASWVAEIVEGVENEEPE